MAATASLTIRNLSTLIPQKGDFLFTGRLSQIETVMMETPTPLNPLGAKGIGESGTIGATPAVQNGVIDAVSHLGVRHIDMPLHPMRVWEAIRRAQET